MSNSEFIQNLQNQQRADAAEAKAAQLHAESLAAVEKASKAVVSALAPLSKVEISNPVTSVKTPDVAVLVDAVKTLTKTVADAKPDDTSLVKAVSTLSEALKALPESIVMADRAVAEQVEVTNQPDLTGKFDEVTEAIKAIDVQPQVNVQAPKVTVDAPVVDLSSLAGKFDDFVAAIKAIKLPERQAAEIDLSGVQSALKDVKNAIKNQTFPVPNYVLPFVDVNGAAKQASIVTSTVDATKQGIVALNPDGSTISGGSGGGGGGTQYAEGATSATSTGTVAMGKNGTTVKALTTDGSGNLNVNIASGSSSGTQYANGAAQATPTGTVALGFDGANVRAVKTATDGTLKVDGSATTQPVSGTVAVTNANLDAGLSTLAKDSTVAKDATLTGGSQKSIVRSGSKGTSAAADVTSTIVDANTQALDVSVKGTVPVSLASNTPDVTDRSGRLLGHVTVDNASIAVTGPLTDTQLRATAVPVSGTFWQATQPISAASLPLPAGAALDATLTGGTAKAITRGGAKGSTTAADVTSVSVDANTQALHTNVTNFPVTQAVSGTVTANTGLSQPLTDTQLRASAVPVSLATNTPTIAAGTAIIGKVGIDQTTPGTTNLVALAANQSVNNAQVAGTAVSTGNGTSGAGVQRVVIASDNTAYNIKVSDGTNTAAVKAASTTAAATDPALVVTMSPNTGNVPTTSYTQVFNGTTFEAVLGAAARGMDSNIKAIGGTAVSTGNGVSGAGVLRVAIASDNTSNTNPFLVAQQTAGTSAITSVTAATSSTSLLAANTSRKGAYFYNDSTATLYLAFAATASTTAYTLQVPAGGFYEMPEKPLYTGLITGIWSAVNGAVRVTELT